MPRAVLLLSLLLLASSVRADDVSEAALAGRWKVVGTAPTAKNRDGLAELEKHGCYLYFEFAANGRAAIGIGSDSKAKLAALQKANPDVGLEWAAKFEVANGRVEISGFPARLREPGGWLGDSATAIFRARLDGDTLELTGPGGFVAFQKVKQVGAPTAKPKANPKADAIAIVGEWQLTASTQLPKDTLKTITDTGMKMLLVYTADGTVKIELRDRDGKMLPTGTGRAEVWKYRVQSDTEIEFFDVPDRLRNGGGPTGGKDRASLKYKLSGDTLELTEADGKNTMTLRREKK